MKIHIIAYPDGITRKNFTVQISYEHEKEPNCPLFLKDGTHIVPEPKTYVKNIPLVSGFSFSGLIFEEPTVDEEKEEVFIHVTDIMISRDERLQPELTKNAVAEILALKNLE